MSKMDGLRAMREARYAEAQARAGKAQPPTKAAAAKPAPVAPPTPKRKPAQAKTDAAETTDALCGHRSMNGRTCTREQGHAAKSHRYG